MDLLFSFPFKNNTTYILTHSFCLSFFTWSSHRDGSRLFCEKREKREMEKNGGERKKRDGKNEGERKWERKKWEYEEGKQERNLHTKVVGWITGKMIMKILTHERAIRKVCKVSKCVKLLTRRRMEKVLTVNSFNGSFQHPGNGYRFFPWRRYDFFRRVITRMFHDPGCCTYLFFHCLWEKERERRRKIRGKREEK